MIRFDCPVCCRSESLICGGRHLSRDSRLVGFDGVWEFGIELLIAGQCRPPNGQFSNWLATFWGLDVTGFVSELLAAERRLLVSVSFRRPVPARYCTHGTLHRSKMMAICKRNSSEMRKTYWPGCLYSLCLRIGLRTLSRLLVSLRNNTRRKPCFAPEQTF